MRLWRRSPATPPRPVATAVALCVAAAATGLGVARARGVGPLAFAPLVALAIWSVTLALLASRLWDLAPADRRPGALRHLVRIVALMLGNLVLLDVVANLAAFAVIGLGARAPAAVAGVVYLIAASERFISGAVYALLTIVALLGSMVLIFRALGALARWVGSGPVVAKAGVGVVAVLVVVESCYAVAVNAARVLPVPVTLHHTTVVDVRTVRLPMRLAPMTFADVRSWRPAGGVERILLGGTDDVAPARVTAGQPVVVTIQALGLPGVAVVLRVEADLAARLPALVAAVPSAEWPRKWLIGALVREKRWSEVVAHLREYRRHYPDDDDTVRRVLTSLNGARETAMARAVAAELLR